MDARLQVIEAAETRACLLANGDADGLESLLHENFRWTSHVGETFNRHDYIQRNTQGFVRWHSQQLSNVEVMVEGDAAVLRAEVIDMVWTGCEVETFQMPMTQVWVRQDHGWRCLAGHAGPRRT
jgi:ketosteroid isomerase-like protein